MTRTVTAEVEAQLNSKSVIACHLVEMQFRSGTVRLADAPYNLTHDDEEWTGLGHLGSIEPIRETASFEATGMRYTLAGPIAAYLSLALNEHIQGDPVLLRVAFFNEDHQIIDDPVIEQVGRADAMTVVDGGEQSSISVTAESRAADFARARIRRFSDADQQAAHAGDKFFEFVAKLPDSIIWPAASLWKK